MYSTKAGDIEEGLSKWPKKPITSNDRRDTVGIMLPLPHPLPTPNSAPGRGVSKYMPWSLSLLGEIGRAMFSIFRKLRRVFSRTSKETTSPSTPGKGFDEPEAMEIGPATPTASIEYSMMDISLFSPHVVECWGLFGDIQENESTEPRNHLSNGSNHEDSLNEETPMDYSVYGSTSFNFPQ